MGNIKLNNAKDFQVFRIFPLLYSIKGRQGLWIFITQPRKTQMAVFCSLLDKEIKATVPIRSVECLERLHIFTDGVINSKEIKECLMTDGKIPPAPLRSYHLKQKMIELLQSNMDYKEVSPEDLIKIMTDLFPDHNHSFKFHHMEKIWKWFGTLKKYYDLLPNPEEVKIVDEKTEEMNVEEKIDN